MQPTLHNGLDYAIHFRIQISGAPRLATSSSQQPGQKKLLTIGRNNQSLHTNFASISKQSVSIYFNWPNETVRTVQRSHKLRNWRPLTDRKYRSLDLDVHKAREKAFPTTAATRSHLRPNNLTFWSRCLSTSGNTKVRPLLNDDFRRMKVIIILYSSHVLRICRKCPK